MKKTLLVLAVVLMWPNKPVFAFDLWSDIQEQTQWTLGNAVAAGTSISLVSRDSLNVQGGQFLGTALAQLVQYRYLSLWGGGTFIPQTDQKLKAIDTAKVGFNINYIFSGFTNQPPN